MLTYFDSWASYPCPVIHGDLCEPRIFFKWKYSWFSGLIAHNRTRLFLCGVCHSTQTLGGLTQMVLQLPRHGMNVIYIRKRRVACDL